MTQSQRIPCITCKSEILPSTAEATLGLCMPCLKKTLKENKKFVHVFRSDAGMRGVSSENNRYWHCIAEQLTKSFKQRVGRLKSRKSFSFHSIQDVVEEDNIFSLVGELYGSDSIVMLAKIGWSELEGVPVNAHWIDFPLEDLNFFYNGGIEAELKDEKANQK